MARFCDLGIESDAIIGKGIDIDELFDKRIVIEKVKVSPTKFPGKNASGMRMQMQICLATFNDEPDDDGDYFVKDSTGKPVGERRSCFTGSDELMREIEDAKASLPDVNAKRAEQGKRPLKLFPFDTTIVKVGKCFQFT